MKSAVEPRELRAPAQDLSIETCGCGAAMQGSFVADCRKSDVDCRQTRASATFLVALIAVTALGPLAMSSFVPALPNIQRAFVVSPTVAQLALSVSILTMALSSLIYGQLADRYGRRPVMVSGVLLAVCGSLVCAVAADMVLVIIGRAMQAAGATVGFVLARVVVRDVYGEQRATSVLSYVTAAITLAPLVGPIIGGHLIENSGWRSVFWGVSAYATLSVLVLLARMPETRPCDLASPQKLVDRQAIAALLAQQGFARYLFFGAGLQGTFMAFLAGAPFVLQEFYRLPASAYGWYFFVVPIGYFVGSVLSGKFSASLGIERCMRIGGGIAVCSCTAALILALAAPVSAWTLFGPAAVLATAHGIAQPSAQIGLLNTAGERAGMASGVFSFCQLSMGAAIAQLVGYLLIYGPAAVAACMLATAVLAVSALSLKQAQENPAQGETA